MAVSIEEQWNSRKRAGHGRCGCVERTRRSDLRTEGNSNMDGLCHKMSRTLTSQARKLSFSFSNRWLCFDLGSRYGSIFDY